MKGNANMSKQLKRKTKKATSGILSGTKLYGFELFMATVGLLAMAFVVDYGLFSLFRHFLNDVSSYQGSDDVVIFLVAAMLVWLPIATIFYLRSRGEAQSSPEHVSTKVHKVLVSVYMVVNTVVAIGALLYAVYALLELVVGTAQTSTNPVLRQVLPSLLMALWHGGLLFAFTKRSMARRRVFPISYAVVTVTVILALFIVTVGGVRASALDQKRTSDLSSIQNAIDLYEEEAGRLPISLEDVEVSKLNNGISEYSYRTKGATKYELCSEFLTNTVVPNRENGTYERGYANYPAWGDHKAGLYCYKVKPVNEEPIVR